VKFSWVFHIPLLYMDYKLYKLTFDSMYNYSGHIHVLYLVVGLTLIIVCCWYDKTVPDLSEQTNPTTER